MKNSPARENTTLLLLFAIRQVDAKGYSDMSGSDCDDGQAGYGWGGNWIWWIIVIIIILIIICVIWALWSGSTSCNDGNGNGNGGDQKVNMTASLDGEQEVPGSQSLATGNGRFVLSGAPGKQTLAYEIVVSDFSFEAHPSHFCHGKPGQKGRQVKNLGRPEMSHGKCHFKGVWKYDDREPLTKERAEQLMRGEIYVNVCSSQYPEGEVRGQVHHR